MARGEVGRDPSAPSPCATRQLAALQTVCKPKIPSMSAVKLWGRSWLTPLSIPLPFHYFFTLKKRKKKKGFSAAATYSKKKNKIHPKPTLCSFSVSIATEHSWPKQLSCLGWRCLKAATGMGNCGHWECGGRNICIGLLRDVLTLLPSEHCQGHKDRIISEG